MVCTNFEWKGKHRNKTILLASGLDKALARPVYSGCFCILSEKIKMQWLFFHYLGRRAARLLENLEGVVLSYQ